MLSFHTCIPYLSPVVFLFTQINSLVYARVSLAHKDMEPELECFDAQTRKSEGFGELKGGFLVHCSLGMCRMWVFFFFFLYAYPTHSIYTLSLYIHLLYFWILTLHPNHTLASQVTWPVILSTSSPRLKVPIRNRDWYEWTGMDQYGFSKKYHHCCTMYWVCRSWWK